MSQQAVQRSAMQYAEYWEQRERAFVETLANGDEDACLLTLQNAAGYFKIARNFRKAFDVGRGLARLAPVRDLLHGTPYRLVEQQTLGPLVESLRHQLGALYGGRDRLSAATKFLWLLHGDPVIIFDSQARIALGTPHANYDAYVERWRDAYTLYADAIRTACHSLPRTSGLAADPKARSERARVGFDHEWFRRRVFDIHLWNIGAAKQRLPSKP
jgi:hypothetical protein